jgi:glycosyltransferase involved in cell wall biosynthesis
MKQKKDLNRQFNHSDTLIVISSFPAQGAEVAVENAVARYTALLLKNFPQNQKVIVLAEKRHDTKNTPYLVNKNILVIPTYTRDSLLLFYQLGQTIQRFFQIRNIHIQFEFSIFGYQGIIASLPFFLAYLKSKNKYISIMLHQVVKDINTMGEHIGIKSNSLLAQIANVLLHEFFRRIGHGSDVVFVHDRELKKKLSGYIPAQKIKIIPHGIDSLQTPSLRQKALARKKYGFKSKDRVVLLFGYQSWYKGSDWVVAAIGTISKNNPNQHIKLLIAGGTSPTQKDDPTYQKFWLHLQKVIEENKATTIHIGFIPEKEVSTVFAAADIVVFPYRARIAASGVLSVTLQHQKPFLISKYAIENLAEEDVKSELNQQKLKKSDLIFDLKIASFEKKLLFLLKSKPLQLKLSKVGKSISNQRSWPSVAKKYQILTK